MSIKEDVDYWYISYMSVTTEISPQRGSNLTGIPRKIRDSCAEWHNLIQRWNQLNIKGLDAIQLIINLKLNGKEPENEDEYATLKPENVQIPKLQQFCDILEEIFKKMVVILDTMKQITDQYKQMVDLQHISRLPSSEICKGDQPVFQTWPVQKFWESAKTMLSMYSREMDVKCGVLESIAHVVNKEDLLFLMATWVYEPYITPALALQLEAMLTDAKFR